MRIEVAYSDLKDRAIKAKEQEAKGLQMFHDNFDKDWKPGEEPRGTMIFDEPMESPIVEAARDLAAELDELEARVALLEKGGLK